MAEASRHVWILLCASKEPPIEEMSAFLSEFGLKSGGLLRCDRGGELARSTDFITSMQRDFGYKVETTGADSPNQNGGAERYNRSLAITVRSLLYGASLHAKYWSAALIHAAYLHNRRIHHSALMRLPRIDQGAEHADNQIQRPAANIANKRWRRKRRLIWV